VDSEGGRWSERGTKRLAVLGPGVLVRNPRPLQKPNALWLQRSLRTSGWHSERERWIISGSERGSWVVATTSPVAGFRTE
jgi:hypothetical protein